MINRRNFLRSSAAMSALAALPLSVRWSVAQALTQAAGLSDPALQPKFTNLVPDAMAPGFIYQPHPKTGVFHVDIAQTQQYTGLVNRRGSPVATTVWGYGTSAGVSWPGPTFEVQRGTPTQVKWSNKLTRKNGKPLPHLLSVDESAHWCYSLEGYTQYSIEKNGVPTIAHLHGGHSDFQYDGNPEFFMSPGRKVVGPQWHGNVEKTFTYSNDQVAGNLWYHDHALGITRLNVYAGLAGFYFIRDSDDDSGKADNPLGLPAWPYEKAYAIQDRMFKDTGDLFYSAFPGDPFYDDFITGEGAVLPPDLFPNGGPTALAEFFGDHMVVNGMLWPKEDVEPRHYRLRLLNGTDSRFMVVRFKVAATPTSTDLVGAGSPLPFFVIGSDQGLAESVTTTDTLLVEPGSRYDVVVDFSTVPYGSRVIMENIGGDAPFGGDYGLPPEYEDWFEDFQTDRIMAFDVSIPLGILDPNHPATLDPDFTSRGFGPSVPTPTRAAPRKVALFEGKDEFGRLQPLLGTAEPATDSTGAPINWPDEAVYSAVGLVGPMQGSIAWHSPTTENPVLGSTEEWEIWNVTGDAHPVHLHLVHFEVIGRKEMLWDSHTIEEDPDTETEEDRVIPNAAHMNPAGDGTYLETQPTVQHNSDANDPDNTYGIGFRIMNPTYYPADLPTPEGIVENTPKDMVTALPAQVTRIKATFDKPGRYVWHCHILSHEDHEMMRVLHVGPDA